MRRLLCSLLVGVFFALSVAVPSGQASAPPEVEELLHKIASRHYRWVALRADILLFFAGADHARAMCSGELLYHRLEERMFLSCVDTRDELVFAFRSFDRRFDLYLPSQQTVYHGTIFDLEDSPEIESHLQVRDLYRALKPLAVDPRRAKIDRANPALTSLDVYSQRDAKGALARKLYLSSEGDVLGEIFYDPKGRPETEIQRYDFREIPMRVGAFHSIIFPKKITILSSEKRKGSAIFFVALKALDDMDPMEFVLRVPQGTKEVFLDEKNPRFAARTPPPPKPSVEAAKSVQSQPAPTAKPRKASPVPEKAPKQVEKVVPKKEEPPAPKATLPATSPQPVPSTEPVSAPPAPKATPTPETPPEDISLPVEESPNPYDALNSLDPSLDPLPDMVPPEKTEWVRA